ncbi:MAG: ribose 5-phosphate isomerase B, partial [Bradymonadia bacterium]
RVIDFGPESATRCDYPDFAVTVARHVQAHGDNRGILVCGSGIGMSMAVNRFTGVRGALVHNGLAARLSRQHNDANVLCLGARLVGIEVAKDAITGFLNTEFEGGRHQGRVAKIDEVAVNL